MIIHVVQSGETIQGIAEFYGVPVIRLIQDNGLEFPEQLVTGQTIVVTYPKVTYIVKNGDTLISIANLYNISIIQLYRNNPYLMSGYNIRAGDILVIEYDTKGSITTHGNTVPYINLNILRKTLPYLTYLSILNYTATKGGEIITYYDDTELIKITKEFGVIPLMLLTTLTIEGEANIGITFDILLNEEFQKRQVENIIRILKEKDYYGVNISIEYISESNLRLYEQYLTNISKQIREQGFSVFVTMHSPLIPYNYVEYERINYSLIDELVDNIIFMNYEWSTVIKPPSPVFSIKRVNEFLQYLTNQLTKHNQIIGLVTVGYDWEVPYSAGLTSMYSLSLNSALSLAYNVGAEIQFDAISQTPYYTYNSSLYGNVITHIVWFVDARSINALLDLVIDYDLFGVGVWNINIYNQQLWTIINSQFHINKILT